MTDEELRFKQLVISTSGILYALDERGVVWELTRVIPAGGGEVAGWRRLPMWEV